MGLATGTAGPKKDLNGCILKEISTTGGVMNHLFGRGRVRAESEKTKKAVLR